MQGDNTQDSKALGAGLITGGAVLAISSIVIGIAAADHMAAAANLCGPVTGHCILCVVSAASLLSSCGVILAGVALRQAPRLNQPGAARA